VSVRFFGQFLVQHGEVDGGHLREALDHMDRVNRNLGEFAIEEGLISEADAERVNVAQREKDRPFGFLAQEMGLLDGRAVERLLARQRETRLPIGEALVQLGHLPAERLGPLLDAFKADQAPYQADARALPGTLADLRSASIALDYLPRFAMRVAQVHLKLGDSGPVSRAKRMPHRVSVALRGVAGLELVLTCDGELARTLAAATCCVPVDAVDERLVEDGLGEFLNVVMGNTLAALEKEGVEGDLDPPCRRPPVDFGWEIETVSSVGEAAVVVRRS
jgi:CheY-specific phosphatase CheX